MASTGNISDLDSDITPTAAEERDMKQSEKDVAKQREHWRIHHPTLGRISVTHQAWMSLSTRKDWQADKWRQLHWKDSEAVEVAKHNNISMQKQLDGTTQLLEKQRRIMERQHTSLQRQLLTDNLRHRLKLRHQQQQSPPLSRRKSQSHEDVYTREETFSIDNWPLAGGRNKPRSLTADGRSRNLPDGQSLLLSTSRERAHTMDNMYLSTPATSHGRLCTATPKSKDHLPNVNSKTTPSKCSSMTDLSQTCGREKWMTELINHLPPDLYAESQAPSRMRKQHRLNRMLSRSHDDCRKLGTEDSRFIDLTTVLVKQ